MKLDAKIKEVIETPAWTILILALVAIIGFVVINRHTYSEESYRAWCKVEHRSDLSYDEWRTAMMRGHLKD